MKLYRIEIITNEPGLQEEEEAIDFGEFTIDKEVHLDLRDIKDKINMYNKVQQEILKIFFPHEDRNKR